MKKITLLLFLITAVLIGSAQNTVPTLPKKGTKSSTRSPKIHHDVSSHQDSSISQNEDTPSISKSKNTENDETPVISKSKINEFALLRSGLDKAFLVVRHDYNVREDGILVGENDFFGTIYGIMPVIEGGLGIDNRFLKPWLSDQNYSKYSKCANCTSSVDRRQYTALTDSVYLPYSFSTDITDTLTSGFYRISDSAFNFKGLRLQVGKGSQNGYLVWFFRDETDNGKVEYTIQQHKIVFNENTIFNIPQPEKPKNIIGGFYLGLNVDEPGTIRLNLMGVARMDPYGGNQWELVKIRQLPIVKDSTPHVQQEVQPAASDDETAIIKDEDSPKKNKKNKKNKK